MGFLVLVLLTSLALLAGLSIARRITYDSRAERLLAATMIASAAILAAVHGCGFLGVLTTHNLGFVALVLFAALIAISSVHAAPGHLRGSLKDLALPFVLPAEAIAITWRARSFAFVGVVASILILAYTGCISYLAPSDAWDGIFYHETMIGYAIQNHGYAIVDVPAKLIHVNTFPRNCEMTSLWFVIFTDRRFVDILDNVYSVPVALAVFCLVRRFTRNTPTALGWMSCLLLMPGYYLQLHSNYIDIHAFAFYAAGLYFGTRLDLRLRDGIVASVCYGLLFGAKSFALAWTPILCFVTLVLLMAKHVRARPAALVGTMLAGVVLIAAFGAPIYVRNWTHYHNVIHPYRLDPVTHKLRSNELGAADDNKPLAATILDIAEAPKPGFDYADKRQGGYGLGFPFLLLPLAGLALPACLWRWLGDLASRRSRGTTSATTGNLVATLVPPLTTVAYTTALWLARYNYAFVLGALVLLAWFLARERRLAEGIFAVCIVTGLMWLHWAKPAWLVTFDEARRLARLTPAERATQSTVGWSIDRGVAKERERLPAGAVVVYSDDIEFPAVLWNETYTNRLQYVPMADGERVLRRLDELRARWFVTANLAPFFEKRSDWRKLGQVSSRPVYAFERVR